MLSFLLFLTTLSLGGPRSALAQELPSILLIGDSHTEGTFGSVLDEQLRTLSPGKTATYGTGGSIPSWWLTGERTPWGTLARGWDGIEHRSSRQPTPLIKGLVERLQPDLVVIEQGTNFLWSTSDAQIRESVAALVKAAMAIPPGRPQGARACAWIGPPRTGARFPNQTPAQSQAYLKRMDEIRALMAQAVRSTGCRWIDSFEFTRYPEGVPGSDAVHYDAAGTEGRRVARQWAESAFEEVKREWNLSRARGTPVRNEAAGSRAGAPAR